MKAVPQNLSEVAIKIQQLQRNQRAVKTKSDEVREKIVELRRQITESRFKAGSVSS